MILVTFAVRFESAAFRRRMAARQVRIVHTGVGAAAASLSLESALRECPPERVIASGFAGALSPEFRVGEIVTDRAGTSWRGARFATSPVVLASAAEKEEFRLRTGAQVVDMETDSIREACYLAGVPLTVLRAISDGAEDDLALPPKLLEALADSPARALPRLAWTLVRDKKRRRDFWRLMRDCRVAQAALGVALEHEITAHSDASASSWST